jgi:FMN phosphatase YigB (HAD superfamily)
VIRAVIFDCFGVLYTDGKSLIIDMCPSEKRTELYDLFKQADYGLISGEEFSAGTTQLLGMARADFDAMTSSTYVRNHILIEWIRSHKDRYKIGLLSNVSEDTYTMLFNEDDERELFDAVVLSSRIGITKPSREAYQLIAERLGVEPKDCIMIDDIERNVEGAENVGMKGLLFRSNEQLQLELTELLEQSYA